MILPHALPPPPVSAPIQKSVSKALDAVSARHPRSYRDVRRRQTEVNRWAAQGYPEGYQNTGYRHIGRGSNARVLPDYVSSDFLRALTTSAVLRLLSAPVLVDPAVTNMAYAHDRETQNPFITADARLAPPPGQLRRGRLPSSPANPLFQHESMHLLGFPGDEALLQALVTEAQSSRTRGRYISGFRENREQGEAAWGGNPAGELFAELPRLYGYDPSRLPANVMPAYARFFRGYESQVPEFMR
jgi:hypothetical protein